MDKAAGGIITVIIVGYIIVAAIAAIMVVAMIVVSTIAAIFTTSFVLSSLYSFNHRNLSMADYKRIGWCSYIAHAGLMLILSISVLTFGYNNIGLDVLWSAFWPFALIYTFEDGLFGLQEYSYVVAGSFFFTCLVVSYALTYFKYVSQKYDDANTRKRMYMSGLGYFVAATLIPAYFLGSYAIDFITSRSITNSNIHEAYEQSRTIENKPTVFSSVMHDLGPRRRLRSMNNARFPRTFDVVLDLDFAAFGNDGRWVLHSTKAGNDRYHRLSSFENGQSTILVANWLDDAVANDRLQVYFGPYGKAAVLHDPHPPGYVMLVDLETMRKYTYKLGKQYEFSWNRNSWLVDDVEARVRARSLSEPERKVYLQIYRHNEITLIAIVGGAEGF